MYLRVGSSPIFRIHLGTGAKWFASVPFLLPIGDSPHLVKWVIGKFSFDKLIGGGDRMKIQG